MTDMVTIPYNDDMCYKSPVDVVRKALAAYDAKQAEPEHEPEKIDDPTMEQWERVIAVEQPCEFWDFTYDSMIRPLSKVFDGIFRDTEGCKWQHCRPIIQQGHTHAWWPEIGKEKPQELPDDALVVLRTHCWHANTIRRVKHVDSWIDVTSFYWPHDLGR